jgi:hypothetical protein
MKKIIALFLSIPIYMFCSCSNPPPYPFTIVNDISSGTVVNLDITVSKDLEKEKVMELASWLSRKYSTGNTHVFIYIFDDEEAISAKHSKTISDSEYMKKYAKHQIASVSFNRNTGLDETTWDKPDK